MPWNMNFHVFLVDPRPFDELKPILDEMFGGTFQQNLEYKADGRLKYATQIFGLKISCVKSETWDEGAVYAISGSNENFCRFDTSDVKDMTFHVLKLLDGADFLRIMTFEEFQTESNRRNPTS
jgi:hypothetical protein